MSYNTIFIIHNRLFPTIFVSTTFGIVNLFSHGVAVIAPLLAELKDPFPMLIFVSITGFAIIASLFLKET